MSPPDPTPIDAYAGLRPGQFTAMISSTALDLPAHRKLVHQACLDAEVFPIGMEQLPAQDASGIAASLEMVDKADIYIGVYAFRYGWVPDGEEVSITEMEFDRALARKAARKLREILVFTAHEEHAVTKRDVEADKVAQEKLDKFKARAADGRVRREFKSAEELHRLVYQALSEFKSRQQRASDAATVTRPAHTSVPNNLPPLQPVFGRAAELAQLREVLDPGNRTWGALIVGPGGMGKTALALRAAYDYTPEQFKRIVFVSVKNRELDDDGVRELDVFVLPDFFEILDELSRELARADITEAPEDERVRLLFDVFRDERALLILDNLDSLSKSDRDRLFTFVKRLPQGCKAILTSRRRIGSGSEELTLGKISRDVALEILADLARRNPLLVKSDEGERVALHEQVAGNPLLLRWVAGQLGRESRRTFADALKYLRSCPEDNNPLEFVFGDLVSEFTEAETKILCALTHFSLPAKVEHIGTVAGCDEDAAETALRSLTNRSLVVPDNEETAFILGPLIADYLRWRKPEAVAETGARLEYRAYALAVEKGYQKYDEFPVLEAAWPLVSDALPRLLAGPNDQIQTVCGALHNFLNFTGRWDEWLVLSQDAESKAVGVRDFRNAGWRAYEAGWVHSLRQQSAAVFVCASRAEIHWREAKVGARERAVAIRLRGIGHKLAGDYPAAIAAYREAVELWRSLRLESTDVASGLNVLAEAELSSGDLAAAERDFREAMRIARSIDYLEGIAYINGNLVQLALMGEDWLGAEALAFEALTLSENVGRRELIAENCKRLAETLARQDRKPEALSHARRAVEIFTALRSPKLEGARQTLAECES